VRNEELERYIRNEYREDNTCWFTAENGHGHHLKLPSEMARRQAEEEPCRSESRRTEGASCCPVLNAISKARPITDMSARGESNGNP
jgi:hypothetical protein